MQDLRYALRILNKNRGFTIVAVVTLALAIGATTAIFSAVDGVLLRSLPYPEADRLAMVWSTSTTFKTGSDKLAAMNGDFYDWQLQNRTFESLAAFTEHSFNLSGNGIPDRLAGIEATGDFFRVFRVAPLLGRTFSNDDDQPGKNQVAVLSYDLWRTRFSSDPKIVGETIHLDDQTYAVIGVMPPEFQYPHRSDLPPEYALPPEPNLWTPLGFSPDDRQRRAAHTLAVIGRLKKNARLSDANADMASAANQIEQQYPSSNLGWSTRVITLDEQIVGGIRRLLWVLLAAVAFVLFIACGNVAGLLLARAQKRREEIAIRHALGASRKRILLQLFNESLLLSLLAGVLGVILAFTFIHLLRTFGLQDIPQLEIKLDWRVLAFSACTSILTGILFGLAPALHISRTEVAGALQKSHGLGSQHESVIASQSALVISQLALTLMLLAGAGLMFRSFQRLQEVNPGFDSHSLLTAQVELPEKKYTEKLQQALFFRDSLQQISMLPGVESAGAISSLPLSHENEFTSGLSAEGYIPPPGQIPPCLRVSVTPRYFEAMRIPLVRGRFVNDADTADAPLVAIVNQTLVKRFFAGQDPIGKHLKFGRPENTNPWIPIVGIVGDVRHSTLEAEPPAQVFLPYMQRPSHEMIFALRVQGEPASLTSAVREAIGHVDPDQAVSQIQTMEQLVASSINGRRFNMIVLSIFAGIALILTIVGLYGLLSFLVAQRTREIGIRIALGASRKDILRMILAYGFKLAAIGVLVGLAGALVLSRVVDSLLFGVQGADRWTLVTVSALLISVAILACGVPSLRAARIDPMSAIRYE